MDSEFNLNRDISLIKLLNTRDGLVATCRIILRTGCEKEALEDFKAFVKTVFVSKKYPIHLVNEYTNVICAMIEKELVLQKAFAALDE